MSKCIIKMNRNGYYLNMPIPERQIFLVLSYEDSGMCTTQKQEDELFGQGTVYTEAAKVRSEKCGTREGNKYEQYVLFRSEYIPVKPIIFVF